MNNQLLNKMFQDFSIEDYVSLIQEKEEIIKKQNDKILEHERIIQEYLQQYNQLEEKQKHLEEEIRKYTDTDKPSQYVSNDPNDAQFDFKEPYSTSSIPNSFEDTYPNIPKDLSTAVIDPNEIIDTNQTSSEDEELSTPRSEAMPSSNIVYDDSAPTMSYFERNRLSFKNNFLKFRVPNSSTPRTKANPESQNLSSFPLPIIHNPLKTEFEITSHYPIHIGATIAERYQIIEYIGSAAFSKAVVCIDLVNNIEVCVKIVRKRSDFEVGLSEVKVLKYLSQFGEPDDYHIVKILDFFYFKEHLFIVSEILKDNLYEFYQFNRKKEHSLYFSLPRLQKISRQILTALYHLHSHNLIHCDLKPENILIKSYSQCQVKLIDFGSSLFLSEGDLTYYIQSRSYRAPEVILGIPFDTSIDIWSFGALIAELYSGHVLFTNGSVQSLLCCIQSLCGPFNESLLKKGQNTHRYFTADGFTFERDQQDENEETISLLVPNPISLADAIGCYDDHFLNFLRGMLLICPEKRMSAIEALHHPWLQCVYPNDEYLGNGLDQEVPVFLSDLSEYQCFNDNVPSFDNNSSENLIEQQQRSFSI